MDTYWKKYSGHLVTILTVTNRTAKAPASKAMVIWAVPGSSPKIIYKNEISSKT